MRVAANELLNKTLTDTHQTYKKDKTVEEDPGVKEYSISDFDTNQQHSSRNNFDDRED